MKLGDGDVCLACGEWRVDHRPTDDGILACPQNSGFVTDDQFHPRGDLYRPVVAGVGPDAPTVTNGCGAKQSGSPYRCDLLPAMATLRVAEVLAHGAAKYGDNNWRGIPVGDHLNHAVTHVLAHLAGDTQDDHLGHAACRLLMALEKHLEGSPRG